MDLINKKSINIHLEGDIKEYNISFNGDVNLYLKENKYEIQANISLIYDNNNIELDLIFINEQIYVTILNQTIKLNINNLNNILTKIEETLDIKLPEFNFNVSIDQIIDILKNIILTEDKIEINLETLGLGNLMIGLELKENKLYSNIMNDLFGLKISLKETELKDIILPEVNITEESIDYLLEYVKDIKTIIDNKHVYLDLNGIYNDIEISGNMYIDFKDILSLNTNLEIIYKEEAFNINIKYLNDYIYLTFNNIKLKVSINEILEYIPQNQLEVQIDDILNILKKLEITENNIEIILNLEFLSSMLKDLIIDLTNTENGFDVSTNLYNINISIDTTKTEDIIINEEEYSSIVNYSNIAKYLMDLINKKSINVHLEGDINYNNLDIILNMDVDFVLNESGKYDISVNLNMTINNVCLELSINIVDEKVFIKLYDNIIMLNINELDDFINEVLTKLNINISDNNSIDISKIIILLQNVYINENNIKIDLKEIISKLSLITISFDLSDNLNISINENSMRYNIFIQESTINNVEKLIPTLTKDNLLLLIDKVKFMIDLYSDKAIHIEIMDTKVNVEGELITLNGNLDILFNDKFILKGDIFVSGYGIFASLGVVINNEYIYLTISGQTIKLAFNELDEFIYQAKEIMSSIINQNTKINDVEVNIIDISNMNIIFNDNMFNMDLSSILGKVCTISLLYNLATNMNININATYDNIVLEMPIIISQSTVEEIVIPADNILTKDDILELLTYLTSLYDLIDDKEFNLDLYTEIINNGSIVASIDGILSIKLLENNEFDARLNVIIKEFNNGNQIAWHNLDVNVISLTTMKLLDSSSNSAMVFANYGNDEANPSSVVSAKSTYKGIIDLIESVINLTNIDIPALDQTVISNIDLSNIINHIFVSDNNLNIGINLKSLFAAMIDENPVLTLNISKNDNNKIDSICVSNLYVSYTNTKNFMMLNNLKVEFIDTGLSVEIPVNSNTSFDVSNGSYLFEALYNNALEKNFEITGTATLTALGIIDIDVPLVIKVNVDENGAPIIYAHLNMWDELGLGTLMVSKKHIYIYYIDDYVYIHRDDKKDADDRKIKIHYEEFFNNIVYYLMDYSMGLPESIIELINSTPEGDGFIDASKCVNSANIGTNTFSISLNLGEIADNNDLNDLNITLSSIVVAKTDSNGNYIYNELGEIIYVPMIYSIPKFEFKCVDVVNVNSSSLVLSNIIQDDNGNYIVKDVSLQNLFDYVNEFNANFNADEEYIYSNNTWISNGRLKHNVVFDLDFYDTIIVKQGEGEQIVYPYKKGHVFEINGRYYMLENWYYDSSYLKPVNKDLYMLNQGIKLYARLVDITIELNIYSIHDDLKYLKTYEGADILKQIEDIYSIKNIDGKTYKFLGIDINNINDLKAGSYTTNVIWSEVYFDFVLYYENYDFTLIKQDSSIILNDEFIVYRNDTYYLYDYKYFNSNFILEQFGNLFTINEELERFELTFYSTDNQIIKGYNLINYSTPKDEFNPSQASGFYINGPTDISQILPNYTYDSFAVNAWVDENDKYYSFSDLKSIDCSMTLKAYIATKTSYFTYEMENEYAIISGYDSSYKLSTIIFPEYIFLNSKWVNIKKIKKITQDETITSPFKDNKDIVTIVFNNSMESIEENAFSDCSNLVDIYLPNQLNGLNVDEYSFNMSDSETASSKKFHCTTTQKDYFLSDYKLVGYQEKNWLGVWKSRYYGKNDNLKNSFVADDCKTIDYSYEVISKL